MQNSLVKITKNRLGWEFHCFSEYTGLWASVYVYETSCFGRDVKRDVADWRNGAPIEEAFPYIYPEDREILIHGFDSSEICPD